MLLLYRYNEVLYYMQPNYILNKKFLGFNFSVTIVKDGQRIFYNGQITACFRKQGK